MIADLRAAAAESGLNIHAGKTEVLTSASAVNSTRLLDCFAVDGGKFAVLGLDESTKYLGRKVRHNDPHENEFDNIVAKAWGAFGKHNTN